MAKKKAGTKRPSKKKSGRKTASGRANRSVRAKKVWRNPKTVSKKSDTRRGRSMAHATRLPVGAARVRMYRQGLGDCFLLTFGTPDGNRQVLIDFGSLGSTTTGVRAARVASEIVETTQGRLDLVVATHEHWDHLSGFNQFTKMLEASELSIGQVWMAWTENPEDAQAQRLAKNRQDIGQALAIAMDAIPPESGVWEQLSGVMGFIGEEDSFSAGRFAPSTDGAMHMVRTQFGAKTRYLEPGEGPIEIGFLPGFRVFVLGPPRDEQALRTLGAHGSDELYGIMPALRFAGAPAVRPLEGEGLTKHEQERHARAEAQNPFDARFRRHDQHEAVVRLPGYHAPSEHWRGVNDAWLQALPHLALQLDAMTNNSSLVLAIERIRDGKVMLFPADAQEGSWLSWHESQIKWRVKDGSGRRSTIRAADLLERTVFYKVGHHGSHNATVRDRGLELMGRAGGLVAFIPVDRAVALSRNPKGTWKMPARALYRRLLERCDGLVLRADTGWAEQADAHSDTERDFFGLANETEWDAWRSAQNIAEDEEIVLVTDSFIDFHLH